MQILINSSKTMVASPGTAGLHRPWFLRQAVALDRMLKQLDPVTLERLMSLSPKLAATVAATIADWNTRPEQQSAAIDTFRGDVYRGLTASTLTAEERSAADHSLRILSGLYGILRPLDGIMPYRLEMLTPMSGPEFTNLYAFWGETIASKLAKRGLIVNLASKEYFRAIEPFVDPRRLVEPQFMIRRRPDAAITFAATHAKFARGAFARWLIVNAVTDPADFPAFADHNYAYKPEWSTPEKPFFLNEPEN